MKHNSENPGVGIVTGIVVSFCILCFMYTCSSCHSTPVVYQQQAPMVQQPVASVTPDDYQVLQGPQGQQQVVFYDNTGTQVLMDYLLWQSLMARPGGYTNVVNYYHVHTLPRYNRTYYSSWHTYSRGSYRSYNTIRPSSSGLRPAYAPSRTYAPSRAYTPTYRPSFRPSRSGLRH